MATLFGEIVYESSRAFADDEEEEFQTQNGLSFEIEHSASGRKYLEKAKSASIEPVLCAFVGKVALGFGDGLVSNEKNFDLLAEVFMVGQGENVVDMYLNRPKKKPVARVYQNLNANNLPVLLALFNTHGVPRYMANDVVESITSYMDISNRLLVFHSDTMAYYQSDESCSGKVFYVTSSKYTGKKELPSSCHPLPPPNVIGGVSAALLMHGEMYDKPSLLLAAYGETELVDSISIRPFSCAISQNKSSELWKIFSQFEFKDELSLKPNLNPVEISNLYV